jgi:hypothetical protein
MNINFYIEMGNKNIKQVHSINVAVEIVCHIGEDEYRAKEVDENCVNEGVGIETGLDICFSLSKKSEELHNKLFELKIVKDARIL